MRGSMRAALLLLVGACMCIASSEAHTHSFVRGYSFGEVVPLQCRNTSTDEWGPAPICVQNQKELSFRFGMDDMIHCGWEVPTEKEYEQFSRYIERTGSLSNPETFSCRVRVAPEVDFYAPVDLGIWGVVESSHIHVDNHLNFVFHVHMGKIIGAAAYPVRDVFQFVGIGSTISMHGPVKWFRGSTYRSLGGSATLGSEPAYSVSSVFTVGLLCSLISIVLTSSCAYAWYACFQKERLSRQLLKVKTN